MGANLVTLSTLVQIWIDLRRTVRAPDYRAEQQARREHKHGKGCGCGDKPIRKSNLLYTADGNKMFPSMRPWMISH